MMFDRRIFFLFPLFIPFFFFFFFFFFALFLSLLYIYIHLSLYTYLVVVRVLVGHEALEGFRLWTNMFCNEIEREKNQVLERG